MIEIGGYKYNSQKNAAAFVRLILIENGAGNVGREHKLFSFFSNLLKRHPDHADQLPDMFKIQVNGFGKDLEIAFVVDGITKVFSYNTCIRKKNHSDPLTKAMRGCVMSQTMSVRHTGRCEICGTDINENDKTHVDHKIEFKKLKENFMNIWNGPIPNEFLYR